MFDQDSDSEKIYLMLYASQKPQSVTFLECRERARIIDVGAVALSDVDDVPDAYREFDVLDPLVIVPSHKAPFAEDTNIGREAKQRTTYTIIKTGVRFLGFDFRVFEMISVVAVSPQT